MKCKLQRAALLFLGIITSCHLFAQTSDTTYNTKTRVAGVDAGAKYRTWSIGVNGGILTPYTLIGSNVSQDFTSPDMNSGYGFYIKDQISRSFGLQADFLAGNLRTDHSAELNSAKVPIYSRSDIKLGWSASLSANIIFAHIDGKNHKGLMQPYFTAGAGLLNYTPQLHSYYTRDATIFAASTGFFVPVGVGLKVDLAPGVNLDLGYKIGFVSSDTFDGYTYGSNSDKFSYTHIGLEIAIGNSKKRQLATESKASAFRTVRLAREKRLKDSTDREEAFLVAQRLRNQKIKDSLDVINANLVKARLTMDSDGDGVPDIKDKCPGTTAGIKVDSLGCPLPEAKPEEIKIPLTAEDKTMVSIAIKNLEFYSGTDVISQRSFAGLNRVAQLMVAKRCSLKLEGYTDNVGNADANTKLSLARADAVKGYLVNRGVDASKVTTFGYGGAHPIASNKTPEGRKKNRRIEVTLE